MQFTLQIQPSVRAKTEDKAPVFRLNQKEIWYYYKTSYVI